MAASHITSTCSYSFPSGLHQAPPLTHMAYSVLKRLLSLNLLPSLNFLLWYSTVQLQHSIVLLAFQVFLPTTYQLCVKEEYKLCNSPLGPPLLTYHNPLTLRGAPNMSADYSVEHKRWNDLPISHYYSNFVSEKTPALKLYNPLLRNRHNFFLH